MIVLGAGLSGALCGVLNPTCKIYEFKTEENFFKSPEHKAVLRFRSNKIGKAIGIPFKEVQVRKSIWYNSQEYRLPDIRLTNMYSKKVTGGYYDRSIVNLDTVTRFLPPEDFHFQLVNLIQSRIEFGCKVEGIALRDLFVRDSQGASRLIPRDHVPIISTLPVFSMAKILGLDPPFVSDSSASLVHVLRCRINNCNLNMSMYYPSPDLKVYRASVMGNILAVESTGPVPHEDLMVVFDSLGININDAISLDQGSQLGKVSYDVDQKARKNWIVNLTLKYGIYSLGRFATWKNLLQDDVFDDIGRIKSFISSGTHYEFLREHCS